MSPKFRPMTFATWDMMMSIARQNSAGARTQPCRTPDVVINGLESLLVTRALVTIAKGNYDDFYTWLLVDIYINLSTYSTECSITHTWRKRLFFSWIAKSNYLNLFHMMSTDITRDSENVTDRIGKKRVLADWTEKCDFVTDHFRTSVTLTSTLTLTLTLTLT